MRYIVCLQCDSQFSKNDMNPNVHYSTPEKICRHCKRKNEANDGDWLQDKDGNYYQKGKENE